MKTTKRIFTIVLLTLMTWTAGAQQVNTLYFLENAPMRHTLNPALQPVSDGYFNFTPIGYSSLHLMTPLTFKDLIYPNSDGTWIHALNNLESQLKLQRTLRRYNLTGTDLTVGILNLGFRVEEAGYMYIGVNMRGDMGFTFPKPTYLFGTKQNGKQHMNLSQLGMSANIYTEVSVGYSHKINEQWTVGGKFKFLVGLAYADFSTNKNAYIDMDKDVVNLDLDGTLAAGLPLDISELPDNIRIKDIIDGNTGDFKFDGFSWDKIKIPAGVGAAFDLGLTYKPIEMVQISAAVNDLGFIYWRGGKSYATNGQVTFTGIDSLTYKDLSDGALLDKAQNQLIGLMENVGLQAQRNSGFTRMITARLNVGVDANFWENRVGVGILSQTRFYNNKVFEELTLGGSFRPVNWFNLALTYSLVENGKFSNIGAGISLMPYDGINLTLGVDYIPTRYISITKDGTPAIDIMGQNATIPSTTRGLNFAMGFSIVWGTNHTKDHDKDGVLDKIDMCPNTPKNVKVDALGCPLDTDGDGVPDYLDQYPGTPTEAYGLTDSVGRPIDSDSDGVPDYLDNCPHTPEAARGFVDEKGCDSDSDLDGVADYIDECPNTPYAAIGHTDEKGCPLDTDGDGVPDYIDRCPETPEAAYNHIDSLGCPLDTDGDGVPDYLDECPNTPAGAINHTDEKGCELDTDGDGIPDWKDECPTVPGLTYNKGCPEVKKEIRNLLKKAMQGIQFESGKATILKTSFPLLDQIAATFIENDHFIIEVQGHSDNLGKAEVNKRISDERAHSVMDYLINAGVPAERLSAKGYGMDVPIADNNTKEGRAENRRVEFHITFEEITYETILEHVDSTLYQQHLDSIQPQVLPTDSTNNGAAPQE